jgi:RNA polymerase sigma factor (sigma-70 family)
MTRNSADAEDLSQEVFLQLYRKICTLRGEALLTHWLHRVTVNTVLMHFRRRKIRPEIGLADAGPGNGLRSTDHIDTLPDTPAANSSVRLAVARAVSLLAQGYRSIVILHDIGGYTHEEIARIRGCSVSTSKSQLHRARKRLQGILSPSGKEFHCSTSSASLGEPQPYQRKQKNGRPRTQQHSPFAISSSNSDSGGNAIGEGSVPDSGKEGETLW